MSFDREGYVTTEEMRRKGFIRRENGTICKRNALEMIFEETKWLENKYRKNHVLTERESYFEAVFNALNRYTACKRLMRDRFLAGLENIKANDIGRIRVDGGGANMRPEYMDDAESRYVAAVKAIPIQCRPAVMALFEEKVLLKPCNAADLRIGLDALIKHYLGITV